MKIIMIYDQIQAGIGTKEDTMVPIAGKKSALGAAVMMDPFLKEMNAHILACFYCGTRYYQADVCNNNKKFCTMAQKMGADIVICGPCFDFKEYVSMALCIAKAFNTTTKIPAISAMSKDMKDTIECYKACVPIVKMPKKGGTGLQDALHNILKVAKHIVHGDDLEQIKGKYCYI